eukprot:TRINITY_DN77004_c0_g1_i2.p1 TRINITY_DN77004_c0_g1~~TRINITY_DN77004_c0_g1_i2.p1  ORF type:complete len:107 (+),score=21.84 TRINITY_DN77004_c0_g1_i2:481-801(+)
MKDVMAFLHDLDSKFDGMKEDIKDLKGMYAGLNEEVAALRQEKAELKTDNESLKEQNSSLSERVVQLERKTDDLEGRSKRNNVICHGIPRSDNDTRQECGDPCTLR